MRAHCASTVVMVRPADFGWNEQTARDNEFQHRPGHDAVQRVREAALDEFAEAVRQLCESGVDVRVLEPDPHLPPLPDAVFPNNWFSVWPDGRIYLYPMRTPNRQAEVRPQALLKLLSTGLGQSQTVYQSLSIAAAPGLALEGTGALVFDHLNRCVYGARSERCSDLLAQSHAAALGYDCELFDTASSSGRAFYHSNVVLSIGEDFAVIGSDALCHTAQRERVLTRLRLHKRDVIELTLRQTESAFCANLLQLASADGGRVIALSQTAHEGLNESQRLRLQAHGSLLPLAIPTIESIGGGSVRCMLAEVF